MHADRGEVQKGSAEIFFRKVKFWAEDGEGDAPPVFVGIFSLIIFEQNYCQFFFSPFPLTFLLCIVRLFVLHLSLVKAFLRKNIFKSEGFDEVMLYLIILLEKQIIHVTILSGLYCLVSQLENIINFELISVSDTFLVLSLFTIECRWCKLFSREGCWVTLCGYNKSKCLSFSCVGTSTKNCTCHQRLPWGS